MKNELIVVIGAFGSGKSEYSINLARKLKSETANTYLVDLDVVNPYFRSRDVQEIFQKEGIEVISPEGEFRFADLPMLSSKIMGVLKAGNNTVILDVGGDSAGCRTLARYLNVIKQRGYEMHFVINTKRPFTADEKGIIEMLEGLQRASKLKITELICNTNLMEFTDTDIVNNGIQIIQNVADSHSLKFEKYLVLDKYKNKITIEHKTKIVLNYYLNKPWE